MPCYDPRDSGSVRTEYKSGISPAKLARALDKAAKMEAVVCALLNELDRRDIADMVIADASRNGLIDIMSIWVRHKQDDASKLAADFHKRYSKDEQALIKKLLK